MACKLASRERLNSILAALEAEDFPTCRRRNVRLPGDRAEVQAMCLGITNAWKIGPVMSRAAKDRPELCRLLCEFARAEIPGFQFTSIQVNKDYGAALHVDGNNLGPSMIVGMGNYTGGELWIHDGSRRGRCVAINGQWVKFDGGMPHCVMPFMGRRYTLVFFSYDHPYFKTGIRHWDEQKLSQLGFPLPPSTSMPTKASAARVPAAIKEELLSAAAVSLGAFARRASRHGGVLRVRLALRVERLGLELSAAVAPEAPLRFLRDGLAARLAGEARGAASVQLAFRGLRLTEGDTVASVGLTTGDVVDVVVGFARPELDRCRQRAADSEAAAPQAERGADDGRAPGGGGAIAALDAPARAEGERPAAVAARSLKRPRVVDGVCSGVARHGGRPRLTLALDAQGT